MTNVGTLAARVLKIQNESLSRIAGAQNLGRAHSQRLVISKLSEFSNVRAILVLARAFIHWSRSVQGISFDGTYFDPVSIAAAFIATLTSQAGSGYLEPRLLEEFYVDWEIVPRINMRRARRLTREEGGRESAQLPIGPAMTYERPSTPSLLPREAETRELRVEPVGTKMQALAEEIGPRVRSLHRAAYSNDVFGRTAAVLVTSVSKPVDLLLTRLDGVLRGAGRAQMPRVFSETVQDMLASQSREASARLEAVLREDNEAERETLPESLITPRTSLGSGRLTEAAGGVSIRELLIQVLDMPLRRFRRAYSRYVAPQQSLTLVLSPITPSISEAMPRADLGGRQLSMQALSATGATSPAEAFRYVFTFLPTRHTASGSPIGMPIEIPLFPSAYTAAAMYMHRSTETTRRLLSPLPSLLSTTMMLSGGSMPAAETGVSGVTLVPGMHAASRIGLSETMAAERQLGIDGVAEWMRRLEQAAIVVQRRFVEAMNEVRSHALRVYRPLIQTAQRVTLAWPHATTDSAYYTDTTRDHVPSIVPQMPSTESLTYLNFLLYSPPIRDMMTIAATSNNVWPRIISKANGYVRTGEGSDAILPVWSSLPRDQIEMNRPYTAVMQNLISYASASAPSTTLVPPQVPDGLPSARLHEAVSFLLSTQEATTKEPPPATRQERVVRKPLPVTIEVDSLRDETEIRDLQRKIARIIKDEARRYGVYS